MGFPTARLVFDRKHKATRQIERNGRKGLVQLEVSFNRERKWISTGVSVYKDQWDDGLKVINHMQRNQLNSILESILLRVYEYIRVVEANHEPFELDAIEKVISTKKIQYRNVSDAIRAFIERMENDKRKKSTIDCYRAMLNKFVQYGGIVSFSDLTVEKVKGFDHWMTYDEDHAVSVSSRREYHLKLSAVIKWLMSKNVVSSNPYDWFKPKKAAAFDTIKYLNDDECKRVEEFRTDDDRLAYARDVFLFMRYTGMAFSDAVKLTLGDIEEQDGKRVVRSNRVKNGINFMVEIFEPAWNILIRHGGKLNKYCLSYIDQNLHIVGHVTIGRKITSHMARHTFACWALKNGVPIPYIAKMLGHSNIETTQIYAEVFGEDLLRESEKLKNDIKTNRPIKGNVIPMFG